MTEPGPDVSARLAWPDDAPVIAGIQAAAWRESYADVFDVDALSTATLAERWTALITRPPDAKVRVLAAVDRADVRGYVLVHPSYDPDSDQRADGEIGELVVDPAHRRAGHGSRLLQAAADTLRADGFGRVVWWLDADDDARRRFAVSAGWAADGAHRELEADSGARIKQVRLHTALE